MVRALVYGLLAALLLAASPAPGQPAPIVVRVGLVPNDDAATPLLYAQSVGMFAKAGIDLQLELQTSGAAVTAAVVAGTFDMGKSSIVPLINAHQHGLPVVIVAPASVWNGKSEFAALLVRVDSPIKTGKDLEGKLVALQSLNDMNEIAVDAWVAKNGGDPSLLRFVELPMSAGAVALKEGRVDAVPLVQPTLDNALTGGQLRPLAGAYNAIAPQYTNTHHHETAAMVAKFTSIPVAVVEHMQRTPSGTTLDPAMLQPIIDAAAKYKALSGSFPASEMIGAAGP